MNKRGFSLVEMLVVVGILALVLVVLTTFETSVFKQNSSLQNSLLADQDARQMLRQMVSDLRSAVASDNGAYAIAEATNNSLTFFSDVDKDGDHDQVHYFLDGTVLKRGVVKPTGEPAVYSTSTETITLIVQGLLDTNQTIFSYYDRTYAGTTTPLATPINLPAVRLIKINLAIGAANYTTQASIRSLKDNL